MRWLGGLGGAKCGGGWYDWLGTTEATYVEQARQTILGGARESLLFCYGGLQGTTGPKNVAALRQHIPELLEVAGHVRSREPIGLAAYKPPNSHPETEAYVYDFAGMLGLPLVPCHEFPADAKAAFFPVHAVADATFPARLRQFIQTGRPVLLTDGLTNKLAGVTELQATNVYVLNVRGEPKSLLQLTASDLDRLREPLLRPFGLRLRAPSHVGFYPFKDGSWVIENFGDRAAALEYNGEPLTVPARGWQHRWR
jgi:hypothetical protein